MVSEYRCTLWVAVLVVVFVAFGVLITRGILCFLVGVFLRRRKGAFVAGGFFSEVSEVISPR